MSENIRDKGEEERKEKKRGRKSKKDLELKSVESDEQRNDQDKFFIDVTKDQDAKEMISKLLSEANNKMYGRSIILKDLVLVALPKLTSKDIEHIQNSALSSLEKVKKQCFEYNQKNKTNLDLGEYLVSVKNILKEDKNAK